MLKLTCAIVDDEMNTMMGLEAALADFQYFHKPLLFASIAAAVAYFSAEKKSVDVIFSDIQMEGISGFKGIKILKPYRHFLVLVTGYPKKHALKAHRKDIDGFLEKPVTSRQLSKWYERMQCREPWEPKARIIWARELPEILEDGSGRVHKRWGAMVPLLSDQVFKVTAQQNNYLDIWGLDKQNNKVFLGRRKQSLKKFCAQFVHWDIFFCPNSSEAINLLYVTKIDETLAYGADGIDVMLSPKGHENLRRLKAKGWI